MPELPTIQQVVTREGFWNLSGKEQKKILSRIDIKFASLSDGEKNKALGRLTDFAKAKGIRSSRRKPVSTKTASMKKIEENVPRMIGSSIGALVGAPAGIPGMVAGAFVGGGAAEAYRQIGQHITGAPEAPDTSQEAASRIAKVGGAEAGYELLGGGIARIARRVLSPFEKAVSPEAKQAIRSLDAGMGKKKMFPLLPSEALDPKKSIAAGMDILENISEGAFLGGPSIAAYKAQRDVVIDDLAKSIIDQFGRSASPEIIGDLFLRTINGKKDVFKASSEVMYNSVAKLAEDVKVPMQRLKDFSKGKLGSIKKTKGIEAVHAGDDLVKTISKLDDNLDFAVAKDLRSRLISKREDLSRTAKHAPALGLTKKYIEMLDDVMSKALKDQNTVAYDAWRAANDFYKNGSRQFDNRFIKRLVQMADPEKGGDPEMLVKAVFRRQRVTSIKRIKEAIGQKTTWLRMKNYFTQQILKESTNSEGRMTGKKLTEVMYGKAGYGKQMLNQVFSAQELKSIESFANVLNVTQQKRPGTGKVLIQLSQAAAAGTMIAFDADLGAYTIIIGPAILAKAFTNPKFAKWLTLGIGKLPPQSEAFAGFMSRFIGAINRTLTPWEAEEKREQ